MDKKHRERGDNWATEEKDIFIQIMKQSTVIIEDKRTDTNTNKRKLAEWKKVQNKLQELTGKHRDITQMKGFWRRIKLAAKKSVSNHKRALHGTGGGPRPPSPTEEAEMIMLMCPTDFIDEKNKFDSDGIFEKGDDTQDITGKEANGDLLKIEDGPPTLLDDVEMDVEIGEASFIIEDIVIDDINNPNKEIITKRAALCSKENVNNHVPAKTMKIRQIPKKETEYTKRCKAGASHKNIILDTNVEFKEKTFKLMEEEYALKIKYQKQELSHQELRHKLEIDILLQEKEKKAIEIKILKENYNLI